MSSALQSTALNTKRGAWAKIDNITVACSSPRVRKDETLAVTVGFRISGGIRQNFVRRLWEVAYDEHDTGFRLGYRVILNKKRPLSLRNVRIKEDKFVRRAVFFWTRNPELPYRVWATVATEFETILYPKTETEAQGMLFDVTKSYELPASKLGVGQHTLEAKVRAKWGKHIFTERGETNATSPTAKVRVE